jgi:hypothetical protein
MPRRLRLVAWFAAAASTVFTGCSDGDAGPASSGSTLACGNVPACYTDALAAVKACVAAPALSLGPVAAASGVIDGLTCSSIGLAVSFSSFSEQPTGIVPVPSTVTLTTAGTTCAVLGSGNGTKTDSAGNVSHFSVSTIGFGGAGKIEIDRYDDGSIAVSCSTVGPEDFVSAPGALDSCPDAVATPVVVRDEAVTHMGVDLVDAKGAHSTLFTCD